MNNIRSLILKNRNGETFDLNSLDSFLTKIGGFGAEHRTTYEQIEDSFVEVSDLVKQKEIVGTLFLPTYQNYKNFVDFAAKKPLTLVYTTYDTYYIDVQMDVIDKSEKETGGLYCKVKFKGLGLFYKTYTDRNIAGESEGKKYSYKYPYSYINNAASTLQFDVNSQRKCPCRLIILGPATNPSWVQYLNGNQVATGKVNVSLTNNERLIVDTTKIPYSIIKCNHDGNNAQNVYQNSDFSTKRFILLSNGQNTVRISHEGQNDLNLYLERREIYETV